MAFILKAYKDSKTNEPDTYTFTVLYCDCYIADGNPSQFLSDNFLTTVSHEVETGALTAAEAEWLSQLFTSHEVYRWESEPSSASTTARCYFDFSLKMRTFAPLKQTIL